MNFFLLFLILVAAEIATFIAVGSRIGVGMTLLLVIASAIVGMGLVRSQGFATAKRVQAMLTREESPAQGMLEGLALLMAGLLFIIPGFLTDIAAFLLLISPLRQLLIKYYLRRVKVAPTANPHSPQEKPASQPPLEGQSRRLD